MEEEGKEEREMGEIGGEEIKSEEIGGKEKIGRFEKVDISKVKKIEEKELLSKFKKGSEIEFGGVKLRPRNTVLFESDEKCREQFLRLLKLSENEVEKNKSPKKGNIIQEEEEEEEEEEKKKGKKGKKGKYTPLEVQYLKLREENPDVLLAVEVGYRFLFFGKDAEVASQVLGILCYNKGKKQVIHLPYFFSPIFPLFQSFLFSNLQKKGNFTVATIPVGRINIHLERLVKAGHKVGVVNQTETAALKSIGDNKGNVFERKISQISTISTLVSPLELYYNPSSSSFSSPSAQSDYLVSFYEEPSPSQKHLSLFAFLVCATSPLIPFSLFHFLLMFTFFVWQGICVATGEFIYDIFEDDWMREKLESRLSQLNPVELLIPKDLKRESEKVVEKFVVGNKARSNRFDASLFSPTFSSSLISSSFREENFLLNSDSDIKEEQLLSLPDNLKKCVAASLKFLKEFQLQLIFNNLKKFSEKPCMFLNSTTIQNLNLFSSSCTGRKEKDSLFSILNHTVSGGGGRLLRKWISQPLSLLSLIIDRQHAVKQLIREEGGEGLGKKGGGERCGGIVKRVMGVLKKCPIDLEKALMHIFYKKASPSLFLLFTRSLVPILQAFLPVENEKEKKEKEGEEREEREEREGREEREEREEREGASGRSKLLEKLVKKVKGKRLLESIGSYLSLIDTQAAEKDNLEQLFLTENPEQQEQVKREAKGGVEGVRGVLKEIGECRGELSQVESQFEEHLKEVRRVLKEEELEYVTKANVEYLIEVPLSKLRLVPSDWQKQQQTKKVVRYWSPSVKSLQKKLSIQREKLRNLAKICWNSFLE